MEEIQKLKVKDFNLLCVKVYAVKQPSLRMPHKCDNCEQIYNNKEGIDCLFCGENKHIKCYISYPHGKAKHFFMPDMVVMAVTNNNLFFVCESCREAKVESKPNMETIKDEINQKLNELLTKIEKIENKIEDKEFKTKGENNSTTQMSYAKVVKINVKNGRNSKNSNTLEKVRNSIDPREFQASDMRSTSTGGVTFKCKLDDENKIETEIKKKLGSNFNVEINETKKPTLKIFGLYDDKNLSYQKLEELIRAQNLSLISDKNSISQMKLNIIL
ncbi:CLUMA_CG013143, isoform A [Clunio marinus]|uniref:CLUMA_CG013143, isoform A n=1 Tax=Clunio marinus TaxID=568069 RepID=A0A1J1II14_9DIPT|nr:CLUMA_CG013143, isoform A [Clunio marinus]